MKKTVVDSLIIGFALFSMFFGAGNVIFPPYLGLESGPQWGAGFVSYFIADIGLALLSMFAIIRQGSPGGITSPIGKGPSTLLMCAVVLCIGPMLAIPRTAATTYETSVAPLLSGVQSGGVFHCVLPVGFPLVCAGDCRGGYCGQSAHPGPAGRAPGAHCRRGGAPMGPVGEAPLVEMWQPQALRQGTRPWTCWPPCSSVTSF